MVRAGARTQEEPAVSLAPDMLVADVIARWPATVPVFLRRKLGCVGCAMGPFDSLSEVALTYGLDLAALVAELEAALAAPAPPGDGEG